MWLYGPAGQAYLCISCELFSENASKQINTNDDISCSTDTGHFKTESCSRETWNSSKKLLMLKTALYLSKHTSVLQV